MDALIQKGFYFVWNTEGRAPVYKHPSYDSAAGEAKRLARKCPGQIFVVLGAMQGFQVNDMTAVRYDTADLEIPF